MSLLLVASLLLVVPAGTDGIARAESLLREGRAQEAQVLLVRLTAVQPRSGVAHRLLGQAYQRLHRYRLACDEYEQALRIEPEDAQAREGLTSARRQRGPGLFGAIGEWEPDSSAATGWQGEAYFGGIDRVEAYAGVAYGDRYFYTRRRIYAKAYYFFSPTGYLKLTAGRKTYDYPVAITPVPDSNSYGAVPGFEIEIAEQLVSTLRATATYEYFRPTFFHAPAFHATNHKLSGELSWRVGGSPLRLRLLAALLRDPDPATTVIDRAGGQLVTLDYAWQTLLGGGVEFDSERASVLLLLIPNPDLDHSQSWAFVAGVWGRVHGPWGARADYVRSKYSDQSYLAGQSSNVTTLTLSWRAPKRFELSAGYKIARRPVHQDSGPFLTVRIRP